MEGFDLMLQRQIPFQACYLKWNQSRHKWIHLVLMNLSEWMMRRKCSVTQQKTKMKLYGLACRRMQSLLTSVVIIYHNHSFGQSKGTLYLQHGFAPSLSDLVNQLINAYNFLGFVCNICFIQTGAKIRTLSLSIFFFAKHN